MTVSLAVWIIDDTCLSALYLEVLLVGCEHAVEPGQQFFGAMIAVQHDRHAVVFGHQPDVLSARNGTQNGGLLSVIFDALARHEGGATVGELNNHRALDVTCSLLKINMHSLSSSL